MPLKSLLAESPVSGVDSNLNGIPDIPDHQCLRPIGRGSYGEVWLARNLMGEHRAVKIIVRQALGDEKPFEREFAGLKRFEPISRSHESQVDILHVGQNEECFYYVMELADDVSGKGAHDLDAEAYQPKSLRTELARRGRLPFEECLRIALALSTALDHLHQHGLVHRDIKPSNIIFVNGVAKLADIGLVTDVDATRSFVGTQGFFPPEGPGTPQADIYSLGKVLYEISTGRDRNDFPELPTDLRADAEQRGLVELNEVVLKACDPDCSRRYQSASEMHSDLALLQAGKSLKRARLLETRLIKFRKLSIAAAVFLALTIAAYFFQHAQTGKVARLANENLKLADQAQETAAEARRNLYAADINQIQRALEADNLRQARDLLQRQIPKPGEPDLRGFEWRYLWQQCKSEELFSLPGHQATATCVAFSPDGERLLTGSEDKTVKVWDVNSRKLLATLTEHTNIVESIAISPDGNLLVTCSLTEALLWDARKLQKLRSLDGSIFKARFSPEGRYLLTASTNGFVLWNATDWTIANMFLQHETNERMQFRAPFCFAFCFSPNGQEVAVGLNKVIKLLSVPAFTERGVIEQPMPVFRYIAFSPDNEMLAVATFTDDVQLWDRKTLKPARKLAGHTGSVFAAAFAPDARTLATCSTDQTIKIWDVQKGELIRTFKGHLHEVWDVTFSPDGLTLASVSKDGAVKLWQPSTPYKKDGLIRDVHPVGFMGDGSIAGFKGTNNWLIGYDTKTLQPLKASYLTDPKSDDFSIMFRSLSSDGRTLGLGNLDGQHLDLVDLERAQYLCSVQSKGYFAFSSKRQLLATLTTNRTLSLWHMPEGDHLAAWSTGSDPAQPLVSTQQRLAFSADETLLASFDKVNAVRVWNIEKASAPAMILEIPAERVWDMTFSPDGKTLATGDEQGFVRFWQIPSGKPVGVLTGHKRGVWTVRFSPDGRTVATLSDDGTLRLWHTGTGRELISLRFPGVFHEEGGLDFSPDGGQVFGFLSQGTNRIARVLYAPSFDEIALMEGKSHELLPPQGVLSWFQRGNALEKNEQPEQAIQAFSKVIEATSVHAQSDYLAKESFQRRSRLFKRVGHIAEAGADNCALWGILHRDSGTASNLIDLSAFFNGRLDRDEFPSVPFEPFLTGLPSGLQRLPGVRAGVTLFDLRGVVHLNNSENIPGIPHIVEGIQIHRKCKRLHFIHATAGIESDGAMIGAYVLHCAHEERVEVPLFYGRELRDWLLKRDPANPTCAKVGWRGENPKLGPFRIYDFIWQNPNPETAIETIDFVSNLTRSAPFLLAITAE